MLYEYLPDLAAKVAESTKHELAKQGMAHLLWRKAFFMASDDPLPSNKFLISLMQHEKVDFKIDSSR